MTQTTREKRRLPSFAGVLSLFLRFRLRRMTSLFSRSKSRAKLAVQGVASVYLLFGFFWLNQTFQTELEVLRPLASQKTDYLAVMALLISGLMISALCLTVGTKELTKPEWDLEWLMTLPISKARLMWIRILERSFVNPVFYLSVFPPLLVLHHQLGSSWWGALVLTSLFSVPIFILLATLQTVIDTGLRLQLSVSQLKNLKAFFNLVGIALLYSTLLNSHGPPAWLMAMAERLASFLFLTPIGLLLQAQGERHLELGPLFLYLSETIFLIVLSQRFLLHQIRRGLANGSGGLGQAKRSPAEPQKKLSAQRNWLRLSPLAQREFRLLRRDHSYLAQTLIAPLVMIVFQISNRLGDGWQTSGKARFLAVAAFGSASYSLLFSAFRCLNSEGEALWILYTFPVPLKKLIELKVRIWFLVAIGFSLLFSFLALGTSEQLDQNFVLHFIAAFAGVGIFTVIATALGVLSYPGPSNEPQPKIRPLAMYAYLALNSVYIGAMLASDLRITWLVVLVMATLAGLLWKKALRALPYLMDPPVRTGRT